MLPTKCIGHRAWRIGLYDLTHVFLINPSALALGPQPSVFYPLPYALCALRAS
jgi:hypothetical protein